MLCDSKIRFGGAGSFKQSRVVETQIFGGCKKARLEIREDRLSAGLRYFGLSNCGEALHNRGPIAVSKGQPMLPFCFLDLEMLHL
jgi:hypothetical protein